MSTPTEPLNQLPDREIHEWARDAVKDLLFSVVFNIHLTRAGVSSKYICEMNDDDLQEYLNMVATSFRHN